MDKKKAPQVPESVYRLFQKKVRLDDRLVGSVMAHICGLYGIWSTKSAKDPDLPQRFNPAVVADKYHSSLLEARDAIDELEKEWKVIRTRQAGKFLVVWVNWEHFYSLLAEQQKVDEAGPSSEIVLD